MAFKLRTTLTAQPNSSAQNVLIKGSGPVSVCLTPGAGGSACVFFTLASHADIKAGNAGWHKWPHDFVSEVTADALLAPVTGVGVFAVGVPAELEVVQ